MKRKKSKGRNLSTLFYILQSSREKYFYKKKIKERRGSTNYAIEQVQYSLYASE
jgi:hypothetical protein